MLSVWIVVGLLGSDGTWQEGDRVVLVGDTLIEREGDFGFVETEILRRLPDRSLTFRNLGWSADTPTGISRAYFDAPEIGYQRLVEQVKGCRPTLLVVGYGMADSLLGTPLDEFEAAMNRFLDAVGEGSPRLLFLSPIGRPAGAKLGIHPQRHQQLLKEYATTIRKIADERGGTFIDLIAAAHGPDLYEPNEIHLNSLGYQWLAKVIADETGLKSNEREWTDADAEILELVRRKNGLYFQRYRPQNITYLLGFRSYEQGQNAKEIEQLVPMVADLEQQIDDRRRQTTNDSNTGAQGGDK